MNTPGMDQAKLEKMKAAMFLRDFLDAQAPVAPDGSAFNPETNDWDSKVPQPPRAPSNLQQAQYAMPDFFDDMIAEYFKRQNPGRTGGV